MIGQEGLERLYIIHGQSSLVKGTLRMSFNLESSVGRPAGYAPRGVWQDLI